jgi:hypothetical protein
VKKLLMLGLVLATGCASGGGRVTTAPRSDRVQVKPRPSSWLFQDAIVLFSNECAHLAKAFAIDHTDETKPIKIVPKGESETIQLFRPLASGKYGYNFHLKLKTYDARGEQIESFDAGPYYLEKNHSGYQAFATLKPTGQTNRCYLDQRP